MRGRLPLLLGWTLAVMATGIAVATLVVFVFAGSDSDPGTPRHDPRRCPPAHDEGVVVLILPSETGEDLCHYIDQRSGREVTPPFEIPAIPGDVVG